MSLSPSLEDIRVSYKLFTDSRLDLLNDAEFRAVFRLLGYSASFRVWTYSEPTDGGFDYADKDFARALRMTVRQWLKIKPKVMLFFVERGGKFYPEREYFKIGGGSERPAIPAWLRMRVLRRDDFTCGYCGDVEGPFDVDHIIPVSRGGDSVDLDNLICACAACNRSKGARTPEEWIG